MSITTSATFGRKSSTPLQEGAQPVERVGHPRRQLRQLRGAPRRRASTAWSAIHWIADDDERQQRCPPRRRRRAARPAASCRASSLIEFAMLVMPPRGAVDARRSAAGSASSRGRRAPGRWRCPCPSWRRSSAALAPRRRSPRPARGSVRPARPRAATTPTTVADGHDLLLERLELDLDPVPRRFQLPLDPLQDAVLPFGAFADADLVLQPGPRALRDRPDRRGLVPDPLRRRLNHRGDVLDRLPLLGRVLLDPLPDRRAELVPEIRRGTS